MFPLEAAFLDPYAASLEAQLLLHLRTESPPTDSMVESVFAAKGKRLRPLVFLLVAETIGYRGDHLLPMACVCEYIHTASLLHDDVIDHAKLRRGRPSTNALYGDESAVLLGDLIYATSCRLMVRTRNLDVIDTFADTIRTMSAGELRQLQVLGNPAGAKDAYGEIVDAKTASLFSASARVPALLAGTPPGSWAAFGQSLGRAFQVVDDCLDFEGSEESLGKPVFADLAEGRVTLPLLLGMERPGPEGETLSKLVSHLLQGELPGQEATGRVRALLAQTQGLELAKQVARGYADTALAELSAAAREAPVANPEALALLRDLTRSLLRPPGK